MHRRRRRDFGLSGTLTISSLDYNSVAAGFDRLDWAKAFDLDGDGSADVLDPGALLPTPADLSIGFASSLQYTLSGSVTGADSYTYDPDFDPLTNNDVTINNVILTIGDVRIAGTAEFALEKRTVDVNTSGGVLNDASLLTVALTVSRAWRARRGRGAPQRVRASGAGERDALRVRRRRATRRSRWAT